MLTHMILKAIVFDGIWHLLRVLPWPLDALLFLVACLCLMGPARRRNY